MIQKPQLDVDHHQNPTTSSLAVRNPNPSIKLHQNPFILNAPTDISTDPKTTSFFSGGNNQRDEFK